MNLDGWTLVIILGMAAMTVVTRAFFFLFDRPWHCLLYTSPSPRD